MQRQHEVKSLHERVLSVEIARDGAVAQHRTLENIMGEHGVCCSVMQCYGCIVLQCDVV